MSYPYKNCYKIQSKLPQKETIRANKYFSYINSLLDTMKHRHSNIGVVSVSDACRRPTLSQHLLDTC